MVHYVEPTKKPNGMWRCVGCLRDYDDAEAARCCAINDKSRMLGIKK
jgi:hypothetical protein